MYKYTRKEIVYWLGLPDQRYFIKDELLKKWADSLLAKKEDRKDGNELTSLLRLAKEDWKLRQKEDRKEWQKEILLGKDVGSPDGDCKIYGYWDNKTMVITRIEHTKPTPSPLEIEEIEEISKFHTNTTFKWVKLVNKVNLLISNQKKLYQYIKSLNQIK